MGKDLKGRELGVGLVQKKDGRYSARVTNAEGKRIEKNFSRPADARKWISEANVLKRKNKSFRDNMTYDEWFDFWVKNVLTNTVKESTVHTYSIVYNSSIKDIIGFMELEKIKPMNCQMVLNKGVEEGLSTKTISLIRNVMSVSFQSACENELIAKSPVIKSVRAKSFKKEKKKFLTKQEQEVFTDYVKNVIPYSDKEDIYKSFLIILQTGMRIGELMALHWGDIDFENKRIYVRHTMSSWQQSEDDYKIGETKSESGNRIIPMTDQTVELFKDIPRRKAINPNFEDVVLLSEKTGLPYCTSKYKSLLRTIFKNISVDYISIHGLRHTFATRCLESGMQPKTLQMILGHKSIQMTMDLYVHVDDEIKETEMKKLEAFLS